MLTFYKFLPLADPEATAARLRKELQAFAAKGTVLVSREGVNGSLSADASLILRIRARLESPEFFGPLAFLKEHTAKTAPFRRLYVRAKDEIITFKVAGIDPAAAPAPYVSPEEFHAWYEAGREMIVLDTRNEFELGFGKFRGAQNLGLKSFTDFAEVAKTLPEAMKQKTVVTYCTGGIRCEKAAPLLKNLGFEKVFQLEGGILNYFAKTDGTYWEGECFVFDNRIAVNAQLEETATSFCCHCQKPIQDPEVKMKFSETERFCGDCYGAIPEHLKPRWDDFLRTRARRSS